MNFAALKQAVQNRCNIRVAGDPAAEDAGFLTNQGLHLIEISHPGGWPWQHNTTQFTTSASVSVYAFSTLDTANQITKILSVKAQVATSYVPFTYISPEEAQMDWVGVTNTDYPSAYSVEGDSLYFYPTPPPSGYNLTIRTVIAEPDLNADGDTPIMPTIYHGAIVSAAAMLYYETLQDSAKANAMSAQVDRWVQRMMGHSRQHGQAPRIRIRENNG